MHWPISLLDGALGTAFFERLLRFFDFALGLAREDGERHVGDGILRFLQAQVGEATHNLNDGNALVGVNGIDDKVELSLFLGGFAGRAGGGRHDHAARRGGGVDAEHFFDLRDELGRFEELRIDTKNTQNIISQSLRFDARRGRLFPGDVPLFLRPSRFRVFPTHSL